MILSFLLLPCYVLAIGVSEAGSAHKLEPSTSTPSLLQQPILGTDDEFALGRLKKFMGQEKIPLKNRQISKAKLQRVMFSLATHDVALNFDVARPRMPSRYTYHPAVGSHIMLLNKHLPSNDGQNTFTQGHLLAQSEAAAFGTWSLVQAASRKFQTNHERWVDLVWPVRDRLSLPQLQKIIESQVMGLEEVRRTKNAQRSNQPPKYSVDDKVMVFQPNMKLKEYKATMRNQPYYVVRVRETTGSGYSASWSLYIGQDEHVVAGWTPNLRLPRAPFFSTTATLSPIWEDRLG